MGNKSKALAAVMVFGILISGCGLADDDDDKKGSPVPGATGNLVVTPSAEIALAVMNALLTPPGGGGKPSASGITAQTTLGDKNCGSGGTVDFTPDQPTDMFTATFTNCMDENVEVNGTATGTVSGSVMCDSEDLPTAMTGTFNGDATVDVGGDDMVFDFENLGVAATNITYGPGCDLDGGSFTATLTGKISSELPIDLPGLDEDISIDFGSGSLVVDVLSIVDTNGIQGDGIGRDVTMTVDGTATVNSPCKKGMVTIATTQNIMTSQPNVCPSSGVVDYTGAFGMDTVTFDGSCDYVACDVDIGDFLP
jgi:hypothetical protein